jgi:hypothetical protein
VTPLWPGILALLSYAALIVAVGAAASLALGLQRWYTSSAFTAAVAGLTLAARTWADLDRRRSDRRREFFKVLAVGIRDGTGAESSHLRRLFESEMGPIVERKSHARRLAELLRFTRKTHLIEEEAELLRLFNKDLYSPEKYLVQLLAPSYLDAAKSRVRIWLDQLEDRQQA